MVQADAILQNDDLLVDSTKALYSAARELDRAAEVLDRAESMLEGARQNLEWWSCLYQLRAQIQVEYLLLQMFGYQTDVPEVSSLDPRLPHTMQAGLIAVRQGLDVLLPIHYKNRLPPPHYLIDRFMCIWIELSVCGLVLVRIGWQAQESATGGETAETAETTRKFLWERWKSLNLTAGLDALVKDQDAAGAWGLLVTLDKKLGNPPSYGLEARRTALSLIADAATAGIGSWKKSGIWERLLSAELVASTSHGRFGDG
jgi:hypothetical protein